MTIITCRPCREGQHRKCLRLDGARCACVACKSDPPPAQPKRTRGPAAAPTIEVAWEEPPVARTGRGQNGYIYGILAVLPEVQKKPGNWARIAVFDSIKSASACRGALKKKADDRFEFVSRSLDGESGDDARAGVWARYVDDRKA